MENYNYEYVFFEYIYKKLKLERFDNQLRSEGIQPYNSSDESFKMRISPYFSLINTGDIEDFSPEEKKEFLRLFKDISDLSMRDAMYQFVEKTYKKYFFEKAVDKFIFLVPGNFEFAVPTDAIVLGITYNKFDINCPDDRYDAELERQDRAICDIINYIQEELAMESGMKLCVKRINEYYLNKFDIRM